MKLAYKKLSVWLLAVLGVPGCSKDIYEGKLMYGCPNADFKITASVTDENGEPLAGIETTPLKKLSDGNYIQTSEAVRTGSDGKAQISFSGVYSDPDVAVVFKDVDGDANGGTFKTDTLKDVKFTKYRKSSGEWDLGAYKAEVSTKLKK